MLQRLTLVIRLQRDPAVQDWRGQLEMVNPHREAAFQNCHELWTLLENWIGQSPSETPSADGDETTSVDRV